MLVSVLGPHFIGKLAGRLYKAVRTRCHCVCSELDERALLCVHVHMQEHIHPHEPRDQGDWEDEAAAGQLTLRSGRRALFEQHCGSCP